MKNNYLLITALLVLLSGISASFVVQHTINKSWETSKQEEVSAMITNKSGAIEHEIAHCLSAVELVKHLFEKQNNISSQEFTHLSNAILQGNKSIEAISWVPKVTNEERDSYEQEMKQRISPSSFSITQLNDDMLATSTERPIYFPVTYIEPFNENKAALGYDIFSNKEREQTIILALRTGELQITPRLKLVQDTTGYAFLALIPVLNTSNIDENSMNLEQTKGLISSVFKIEELINNAVYSTHNLKFNLVIYDITNNKKSHLYGNEELLALQDTSYKKTLPIGGRLWELNFIPSPSYFTLRYQYTYFLIGLSLSLLLFMLFIYPLIKDKRNRVLALQLQKAHSAKKEIEQSFSESEERWEFAIEGNGDGLFDWEIETNEVFYSKQWKAMLGYAEDELKNNYAEWQNRIHPEDKAQVSLDLASHLEGMTKIYANEHRLRCKDGTYIWVLTRGKIMLRSEGQHSTHLIGTIRNITKRKEIEQTLRISEEKFKELYHNSPDMYISVSATDATILQCNEIFLSKMGYSHNEVIGQPIFNMYQENCVSDVKEAFHQFLITGVVLDKELVLKRKDGSRIEVSINANAIKDAQGKILYSISSFRDISKQTEYRLQESEEKYRALFDNAPLSYQSLDENGCFIDVNPSWLRTLGYSREEVIGKRYADFLHPNWKPHFEKNFPAFKKRGYVNDVQFRIRHKDGHYIDISFEGCIGYLPDGSFKQTYCVFQDITNRKKAEDEIIYLNNLLKETGEFAKVGGWEFDIATGDGNWTDEVARIHDLSPDDITNKEIGLKYYTPESRKIIETSINDAIQHQKSYDLDLELITPKGNRKWVRTIGHPIIENGKVSKLRGSFQDITEQKNAENALAESEEKFSKAFNLSPNMITITQMDSGIFLDFNHAFLASFGYSKEELMESSSIKLQLWDNLEDRKNVISRVKKEQTIINEEYFYTTKDGQRFPCQYSAQLIQINNETFVLSILNDISEQKKTNAELNQYRDNLELLVQKRTEELADKNQLLERINKAFVGREIRMKELKAEINSLRKLLNHD